MEGLVRESFVDEEMEVELISPRIQKALIPT